jgi:hypothetical protein
VTGAGALWTLSDRFAIFGSYNAGLNRYAPEQLAYLGFVFGF